MPYPQGKLVGTERIGIRRSDGKPRLGLRFLTVCAGVAALALSLTAGVWWCHGIGTEISTTADWKFGFAPHSFVDLHDPASDTTMRDWTEFGSTLSLGPFQIQWPQSRMSGAQRGLLTRQLKQKADREFLETMQFLAAAKSYHQLALAGPRLMGSYWQTWEALECRSRAFAAAGEYSAAVQSERDLLREWRYPGSRDSDNPWADLGETRSRIWRLLSTDTPTAEQELRRALTGRNPLVAPVLGARYHPLTAAARSEIRLALAELLLRKGGRREARKLLQQVVETPPCGNETGIRLARAYLSHLDAH